MNGLFLQSGLSGDISRDSHSFIANQREEERQAEAQALQVGYHALGGCRPGRGWLPP